MIFGSLTFAVYEQLLKDKQNDAQTIFSRERANLLTRIGEHQTAYSTLLLAAQSLFAPDAVVRRSDWKAFSENLGVTTPSLTDKDSTYYPIRAFSYIERVKKNDLEKFVNEVRTDKSIPGKDISNYSVFPSGDREEYYPVKYAEPEASNTASALGFDVNTSEFSQPALAAARDTGRVTVTKSFDLKFLNAKGILAFIPIYNSHLPHNTIEERREGLTGYASAMFTTKEILDHLTIIPGVMALVDAEFFQGGEVKPENLIYDSETGTNIFTSNYKPQFVYDTSDTFTNNWLIRFSSNPNFDAEMNKRMGPTIVLLSGGLLTIFLTIFILYLSEGKRRAQKLVEEMTADIKKKSESLQKTNRALKTISEANQVTIKSSEEDKLLKEACKILVDEGGYRLVWIGYSATDKPILKPMAWAGYDEGYVEGAVALAEKERILDPAIIAAKEKRIVIIPDLQADTNFRPWLKDATQRGYKSTIAIPLLADETVLGTMAIYSSELGTFTAEEVGLLESLSRSLSYGVMSIRDRNEKKAALLALEKIAEELKKKNRALLTIGEAGQVTVKATEEKKLIKDVCDVLVRNAGYRMVWVGYAENDKDKSVKPVAWAGSGAKDYIEKLNISWADVERGRGPTGTAIREKETIITPDFTKSQNFKPWLGDSLNHGYVGSVVIPLFAEGSVFGSISIYTSEINLFSSDQKETLEEIKMLEELAGDLSFSILSIRNKDAKGKS